MRAKFWIIALTLVVAALGWWLKRVPHVPEVPAVVKPQQTPSSAPPSPAPAPAPNVLTPNAARPPVPEQPMPVAAPAPAPVAPPPGYFEIIRSSPEFQEAEEVAHLLRNFGQRFGGNPTGSNAEITKALNGGNEKRAIYLPSHARLNDKGELLDAWGNPYFFHSNSATETEVRSAGPDGVMHTRDDLVTK